MFCNSIQYVIYGITVTCDQYHICDWEMEHLTCLEELDIKFNNLANIYMRGNF